MPTENIASQFTLEGLKDLVNDLNNLSVFLITASDRFDDTVIDLLRETQLQLVDEVSTYISILINFEN